MRNDEIESIASSLKVAHGELLAECNEVNDSDHTPPKRKGNNKTRTRILNYLHSIDEPMTACDISFNLNLPKRKTTSLLTILARQGQINVRKPLKHLGERFPSIYWRR
jgi:hypothetical protein